MEAAPEEVKKTEPATAEVDVSDITRKCAGDCGKVILFFGGGAVDSWGDGVVGSLCVDCIIKGIKPPEPPKKPRAKKRKK